MIDAFTPDNGATRFIPGSPRWGDPPTDGRMQQYMAQLVSACGSAGSLLVFDGSTWHGQGVNSSSQSRRSLQGAFIPRGGRASTDFARRMSSETRARLGSVAHRMLQSQSPVPDPPAGSPVPGEPEAGSPHRARKASQAPEGVG